MSLMDKFLDAMRLNGDEDEEYEYEEEYEEDDEYEEPKRKTTRRERERERVKETVKEEPKKPVSKITPINKKADKKQGATGSMEVCVIKPATIEDEIEIADTLSAGRTVLINMEGLNVEIAQRIIDFTSGATYAMHGNLQKVSNFIFLATPNGVDISGDIQNLMDTFGVSGTNYEF